ncbi:hypothetical protein D3C86_2242340 [compost metagenome]
MIIALSASISFCQVTDGWPSIVALACTAGTALTSAGLNSKFQRRLNAESMKKIDSSPVFMVPIR